MSCNTESIRNVALAGQAGAGKTTLFEALLHAGGAIQTAGTVEHGDTVSDTDQQEQARGHSIDSCVARIAHGDCRINLIDTAGYADFRGGTLAALAAVETVAVVVNAINGVEHSTRRIMLHARERGLARLLVVNKIDFDGANLSALVDALREAFGSECLPVNLPANRGNQVLDCVAHGDGAADFSSPSEAHQRIFDQVAEINETVMERYLEDGEDALSPQQWHDTFEQCLREGHLVPICFVSARTGAGVKELLGIIAQLLPNPAEGNPPPFVGGDSKPLRVANDPDAPVIADVFKIINDPLVGKLGVFRVWQGTVRRHSELLVDDSRKSFKVGHLFRMQGKTRVEIDQAIPGDFAAVAKVEEIHFGAVLRDAHEADLLALTPPLFPTPMYGLALEATHKGHEQKLSNALTQLAEEDPCLRVEHDKALNETVLRGLSDLHLKVILERMRERYGVEVATHPPRIAYRETITTPAEGHHRQQKQTGGAGQFGEVFLRIEPLARGAGFAFVDATTAGVIRGQFLLAIETGVRQAMEQGAVAGYPLQDLRVTVGDGSCHAVDSKEVAFISAGKKAFRDAVGKARPIMLEPIVNIEVTIPEHNAGDVTNGLTGKRARIIGIDTQRGGETVIKAQAPLAELIDYPAELKAMTGGRGRYSLDLSHYEAVPAAVQKQLREAWKPRVEEE